MLGPGIGRLHAHVDKAGSKARAAAINALRCRRHARLVRLACAGSRDHPVSDGDVAHRINATCRIDKPRVVKKKIGHAAPSLVASASRQAIRAATPIST